MKKLRELQGGYPRHQDYLLNLQAELMTVADSLFGKLNHDMILRGCEVTNHGNGTVSIAAGIVFVGNEVLRFDGANNIPIDGLNAFVKGVPATSTPTVFADGQTKDVYTETKALINSYANVADISVSQIVVGLNLYTLATYIEDVTSSYAIKGEIKDIYDLDGNFLDNFDSSGLGITPRYNKWALFNGNNGAPNGQGRVRVTVGKVLNPLIGDEITFNHGEVGGATKHRLLTNEMPSHSHSVNTNAQNGRSDNANDRDVMVPGTGNKTTSSTGGDLPHNNMQPYIAVYTIIKIA